MYAYGATVLDYGATVNDSIDDTQAIQCAIDESLAAGSKPVVFPAGTYNVSSTLNITPAASASGLIVRGEGATVSRINWFGNSTSPVFLLNGLSLARFRDFRVHCQASTYSAQAGFDLDGGTSMTQLTFDNMKVEQCQKGFRIDKTGPQASELTIRESTIVSNSVAGISIENSNALNIWLYADSIAYNAIGVSTASGGQNAGNFHMLGGAFGANTTSDIELGNANTFLISGVYTEGSQRFLEQGGPSGAASRVTIQGCTINQIAASDRRAIIMRYRGPLNLIGNYFGFVGTDGAAGQRIGISGSDVPITVNMVGNHFRGAGASGERPYAPVENYGWPAPVVNYVGNTYDDLAAGASPFFTQLTNGATSSTTTPRQNGGGTVSFGPTDTMKTVTFTKPEPDSSYALSLTAGFMSRCVFSGKSTTGFTINCDTAPGSPGSVVDWTLSR